MFIGTNQALLDRDFLLKLDKYPHREVYGKIISLDWEERAITEMTGVIVSGSISVDGSSSVRRTCSLSMIVEKQLDQAPWERHTKFAVLVGLKNYVDKNYEDIIWFQQGIFILTQFSPSQNTNGFTVSLQGVDKMSMLDGSVGGEMFADHDFGAVDVLLDDGSVVVEQVLVKYLVRNLVHVYARESYENIIIEDIDAIAVELLEYRISDQKLLIYDISMAADFSRYTSQMIFENDPFAQVLLESTGGKENVIIKYEGIYYRIVKIVGFGDTAGYQETDLVYPDKLIVNVGESASKALDAVVQMLGEFEYFYDIYGRFHFSRKPIYHNVVWNNAQTNEGETTYYNPIGDILQSYEFVNGDLVETFTNKPVLTNIKNDYSIWGTTDNEVPIHLRYAIDDRPNEYYSLSQERWYYTNENWRLNAKYKVKFYPHQNHGLTDNYMVINEDEFLRALRRFTGNLVGILKGKYIFEYSPNTSGGLDLWLYKGEVGVGVYLSLEACGVTILNRDVYKGYNLTFEVLDAGANGDSSESIDDQNARMVDWRELIYQMAYDDSRSQSYIKQFTKAMNHEQGDKFRLYTKDAIQAGHVSYYNCYYYNNETKNWSIVDSSDFLEELSLKGYLLFGIDNGSVAEEDFNPKPYTVLIQEWQSTQTTGYTYYYADLLGFWRLLYDPRDLEELKIDSTIDKDRLELDMYSQWESNYWYNPDLIDFDWDKQLITFINPDALLFWIDFIGQDTILEKYKISLIGRRSKSVNDSAVKAIFFREVPEVLFIDPQNAEPHESNLKYVKLNLQKSSGLKNYFQISSQGKSAKEALDNLVYNHTYYQTTITLSVIPIYYLEPNTRIYVQDEKTGISGDFIIKSYSFSLAHNGMMSITASEIVERIL